MYQAELLSKRELLADLTCEDVGIDDFVRQWSTLSEVSGPSICSSLHGKTRS